MQQGHALATATAIDRLVHHSVILELNLPSYRLEASKRQISTAQQAEAVDGSCAKQQEQ